MVKQPLTADQALNRAAAYCSKAERCVHDVREKLFAWGLDNREDAEHIVDWLKDEGFIDETRYTRAFIHDKFEYEHWGLIKIARALQAKHISQTLVREMADEVIDSEAYDRILESLVRAKAKGMKTPLTPADRAKVFRFAAQRGFEPERINNALESIAL